MKRPSLPHDLVTRAKAGDARAINAVIVTMEPLFHGVVRRALRTVRATPETFNAYDDAVSEARVTAWRSLPGWDPEDGTPFHVFCWDLMLRRARAVLRRKGRDSFALHENVASLDAPGSGDAIAAVTPGAAVDPDVRLDAQRALSRAKPLHAEVLWRSACDEEDVEIAEALGCSRQNIGQVRLAALRAARDAAADPLAPGADPEAAVVRILSEGPCASRALRKALRPLPEKRIEKLLARLRRLDVIEVCERSGVHVVYAMKVAA